MRLRREGRAIDQTDPDKAEEYEKAVDELKKAEADYNEKKEAYDKRSRKLNEARKAMEAMRAAV